MISGLWVLLFRFLPFTVFLTGILLVIVSFAGIPRKTSKLEALAFADWIMAMVNLALLQIDLDMGSYHRKLVPVVPVALPPPSLMAVNLNDILMSFFSIGLLMAGAYQMSRRGKEDQRDC